MANHRSPAPLLRIAARPQHPLLAFWGLVEPEPNSGCWLWLGSWNGRYPKLWDGRRGHVIYAHRFAYTVLRGPIPDDYDIDHLCRVKLCVNPFHLEPVTRAVNLQRCREARAKIGAI